jgi:2-oxoglutarate dehydrogenase E1 component
MSPKSLLRHKLAKSNLDELANGYFKVVLDDSWKHEADKIERVILCSGKVYYDLFEYRAHNEIENTAVVRIEQLYPFPEQELQEMLGRYPNMKSVVWCQEEPMNQGAWYCKQLETGVVIAICGQGGFSSPCGRLHVAAP